MIKDKKGQFVITSAVIIVALIIAFFLVGGTLIAIFSNLTLLIGAALIVLSLVFGLRGEFNRTKAIFVGGMVLIGIILIFASGITQSVFSDDQIWTVDSGRYECIEDSVETTFIKYVDQDYKFTCGSGVLVDNCEIIGQCRDTTFLSPKCDGGYRINSGSWVYYELEKGETKQLTELSPGQNIEFAQKVFTTSSGIGIPANEDNTVITYSYNPYRLYTIESGKKVSINSQDCCLVNQNKLRKENIPKGEYDCLNRGEVRNYFLDWELKFGREVYDYKGDETICYSNQLYEIEEESLADGTTRKIQGNPIKFVECCPHQDDNCNDNFEFVKEEDKEENQCVFNFQCSNQGDPQVVSEIEGKRETCESGICTEETFTIECASDNKCVQLFGEGYSCSDVPNTFGKCIKGKIVQPICGDGDCDIGETKENCPGDCTEELECKWYQDKIPAGVEEDCGLLNWRESAPLIECKKIDFDASCKTSSWVWGAMIGIVVVFLGALVIITTPKRK